MTQLTQQGLILYKQMLDDTVFIKRQQWATTNYAALIYAAVILLHEKFPTELTLSCALSVTADATGFVATGLLIWFQRDLYKLRKRIETANDYCFVGKERTAFSIKKDEDACTRGWHILAALILVCAVGAALLHFALK